MILAELCDLTSNHIYIIFERENARFGSDNAELLHKYQDYTVIDIAAKGNALVVCIDDIPDINYEHILKMGILEERLDQMLDFNDDDIDEVYMIIKELGIDKCNKGYDVEEYGATGMCEIKAILEVGRFSNDDDAVEQAIEDGVPLIPIDELPEEFEFHYLGWIDTKKNREAIEHYCKYWEYYN